MTILDELAAHAKERVKTAKERISAEEMKAKALALPKGNFAFEKALKKDDIAFICECKKASPPRESLLRNFPIWILQGNMRRPERTASPYSPSQSGSWGRMHTYRRLQQTCISPVSARISPWMST